MSKKTAAIATATLLATLLGADARVEEEPVEESKEKVVTLDMKVLSRYKDGRYQEVQQISPDQFPVVIPPKLTTPSSIPYFVDTFGRKIFKYQEEIRRKTGSTEETIYFPNQALNQTRCVPDPLFGAQTQLYAQFAIDFIYNHPVFRNDEKPDIKVVLPTVPPSQDDIHAYICHAKIHDSTFKTSALLKDKRTASIDSRITKFDAGSSVDRHFTISINHGMASYKKGHPTIILGTHSPAVGILHAPFSEVTAILFEPGIKKYIEQGIKKHNGKHPPSIPMHQVIEAITESFALYMAGEILQRDELADARKYVSFQDIENRAQDMKDKVPKKYALVPAAVKYLQQHGPFETKRRFMNDPQQYEADLRKIDSNQAHYP